MKIYSLSPNKIYTKSGLLTVGGPIFYSVVGNIGSFVLDMDVLGFSLRHILKSFCLY